MTVGELIEELRKFPPHHVVCVMHDDGSSWSEVTSTTESTIVELQSIEPGVVAIDCSHED